MTAESPKTRDPERRPGGSLGRPLRTLLFSTLYPSSVRPVHGIFVEARLRELLKSGALQSKVVAPVPWFWSTARHWGDYALMAATPSAEKYHGIDVLHPRYLVLPKLGMNLSPFTLAAASLGPIQRLMQQGFDFDLIDAHYYYPDGVAAALVAAKLRKPVTITARGTDLNLIADFTVPRRLMQWAAQRAAASVGVCTALVDVLKGWGVDSNRLHVIRNGVDLERFRPMPQVQMRQELHLEGGPILISVGHLVERKGHHLAIEALAQLRETYPESRLVVVGEGEERERLGQQVQKLGLSAHVTFAGSVPNENLARWYSAADMLLLASSREGWANVLLEAMACGTPVVATRIWGTPEAVTSERVGVLVEQRTGPALASAVIGFLQSGVDREFVRRYAEGFGWEQTTRAQLELFDRIASAGWHKTAHA